MPIPSRPEIPAHDFGGGRGLTNGELSTLLRALEERLQAVVEDYAPSPGGGADISGPTIVVGNSVAGDVADEVDYLDDGTGSALRDALAEANTDGGIVFLRRGDYAVGGAAPLTTVGGTARLTGEGRASRLVLPSSGAMYSLLVQGQVDNLTIGMAGNPTGALTDATNRFVEVQGGGLIERCLLEVRATAPTVVHYPFFWSIVRLSQPSSTLRGCRVLGYSSAALGAGNECIALMAIGGDTRVEGCLIGDTGSSRIDVGIELGEGSANLVKGNKILRSGTYGIRMVVGFDCERNVMTENDIRADAGRAIGMQWFGDGTMLGTVIRDNTIKCAAGVDGIDFESPDAARPITALLVQGNMVIGSGGGTGIRIAETGTGVNTEVLEAGNLVRNFGTERDIAATGGLVQGVNS